MATIVKQELSGSTDGRPIKVAATSSAGTTIHTAQSGTGDNNYDEVWAWATNTSTAAVKISIEWGAASSEVGNLIEVTIPPEQGLMQIIPGLVLQNSLTFKVFAASANVVNIVGYVNKITA
tara:strand:+ start:244 stop:606 length:363 start_codon:yes stop_codon:yes gene_type:complete